MKKVRQINDICPHCGKGNLQYREPPFPYDSHLACQVCDSTYLLEYSPLFIEDSNSIGASMIDVMEEKLKDRGMTLPEEKIDEMYQNIIDFLEDYTTGVYRNHM